MMKSFAFAKLDLITIKPYMTTKNLLILIMISIVMGYSGNPFSIIGIIMAYGTIFASYPFMSGDKNSIDTLYATLSIKRSNVVMGRYIFILMFNITVALFAVACSLGVSVVFKKPYEIGEILLSTAICFLLFTTVQAFQLPIFFKMGFNRARFWAYIPFLMFPVVVLLGTALFGGDIFVINVSATLQWVYANELLLITLVMAFWILICTASYRVSLMFYRKRDF